MIWLKKSAKISLISVISVPYKKLTGYFYYIYY